MSVCEETHLPGLNCGLCGYRTCNDLQQRLAISPELIHRCIPLESKHAPQSPAGVARGQDCTGCAAAGPASLRAGTSPEPCRPQPHATPWHDSLGRPFDFYLEHFPHEPGPREIILPHNPTLTRELEISVGDILIGRPLGMSCGCPITHCGVAMEVDRRTGVMTWCVTGPLGPRQKGFKDLGYYIAEGYEGIVTDTQRELLVGARYYFQPRMCMLQWRHSGLMNYLCRNDDHSQVRLEGLWIG